MCIILDPVRKMGELKTALTDQINEVKADLTTALADMRSEQWTEVRVSEH